MSTTQALMAGTAALLIAKAELLRLGGSIQVMDVVDGGLIELEEERLRIKRPWSLDREIAAREMEQAFAEGMGR